MTKTLPKTLLDSDFDEVEDDGSSSLAASPILLTLTSEMCGIRLDKVLSQLVPQYSRNRIQQWIDEGHVLVDGKVPRGKMLALGDEKVVIQPQTSPEEMPFQGEPIELPIVFEDKAVIVLNKPAGLVVHPAAGNWSGTLLNGLLHYFPAIGAVPRAGIVHRLDKETSGLMVVAKSIEAQTYLVRQLQARTVKREYLALVWGTPQLSGHVDGAIGRHPRDRVKMAVLTNLTAKPAVTHYQRLATGAIDGRPVSLMRCQLETGRTHQIRVHMQSLGFSLVGDPLYGKPHLASVFERQALHAYSLGLVHPFTDEDCEWRAPLPEDFVSLIKRAGIDLAAIDKIVKV